MTSDNLHLQRSLSVPADRYQPLNITERPASAAATRPLSIVLHRLTDAEIDSALNRNLMSTFVGQMETAIGGASSLDVDSSESSQSVGTVTERGNDSGTSSVPNNENERSPTSTQFLSASSDSESLVFARFEFLSSVRDQCKLLFVHDIEHLYFYRYPIGTGKIFNCRNRTCKAKVILQEDVCKPYGSSVHSHPSVREDYENLLLLGKVRVDCSEDGFIRREKVREIYDRRITE